MMTQYADLVEILIHQEGRGMRANLGRFEYGRTSGGYGAADDWLEAKEDRIIPGPVVTPFGE